MTGYAKFNYEKFKQMVLFFASHISNLSKTKLNKLLFFADFTSFKRLTVSLSGIVYQHDYYGPVPKNNTLIYSSLEEGGAIAFEPFQNYMAEKIIGNQQFDSSLFSEQEIRILEEVKETFKHDNAEEISRKSHEEKAYSETEMKEDISYTFGLELKISIK